MLRIRATTTFMKPFITTTTAATTTFRTKSSIVDHVKQDHQEIKNYYEEYKKNWQKHNNDPKESKKWFNQWAWAVARHSVAEELVLYPYLREKTSENVDKNMTQHQGVKERLAKLDSMDMSDPKFHNIAQTVMDDLNSHIELEEKKELPQLEKNMSEKELEDIGSQFQTMKKVVPTGAHPNAPTSSPLTESLAGLLLAPMDKLKDMFKSFPSKDEAEKVAGRQTDDMNAGGSKRAEKNTRMNEDDIRTNVGGSKQTEKDTKMNEDVMRTNVSGSKMTGKDTRMNEDVMRTNVGGFKQSEKNARMGEDDTRANILRGENDPTSTRTSIRKESGSTYQDDPRMDDSVDSTRTKANVGEKTGSTYQNEPTKKSSKAN